MNNEVADILIADDCNNDAELAVDALSETNLPNRVVVVNDGVEALDFLYRRGRFRGRTSPPPVVFLLDVKMPKLDGLEVLRRINRDPDLSEIPVVILSSSGESSDIIEARRLGAKAYVVKPLSFSKFVESVQTVGRFRATMNVLHTSPGSLAGRQTESGYALGEHGAN